MKKILVLAFLAMPVMLPSQSEARPRGKSDVQPVARNDGDSSLPFQIGCTSHTWTAVGSTRTAISAHDVSAPSSVTVSLRRRSMTVQTLGTVDNTVCLSTGGATAVPCGDSTVGYELGTPWAAVSIYNEEVWYCRTRSVGNTRLKGVEFYDKRDEVVAR